MYKQRWGKSPFWVTAAVVLILVFAAAPVLAREARYVFLMIGDGMGIAQRIAAEQYAGRKLLMNTFPDQGITATHAADRFITGSAAAGTALASGRKTNIGVLGMDPAYHRLPTIAEMAEEHGMKVGIVSSVSLDHATPAAFYAHVPERHQYYDIGVALARSDFDYFGGGGFKDPENKRGKSGSFQGSVLDLARSNGYTIVRNKNDFQALDKKSGKVLAINPWLQDHAAMPYNLDRRSRDITLAAFTQKGIELLDNENGFFLMVEGGKIDWACHANDAKTAIQETLAFDKAVQTVHAFYRQHPEETLVVVTADHECGGLSLGAAGTGYDMNFSLLRSQDVSSWKFSTEILADFKAGPDPSFDAVKPLISKHFGLHFDGAAGNPAVLKSHEKKRIRQAFARSMAGETEESGDPRTHLLYGGCDPLTVTLTHIVNRKAGLAWGSYKHTGVPVVTSAIGAGAEMFTGAYDNTEIAAKILQIMGLESETRKSAVR